MDNHSSENIISTASYLRKVLVTKIDEAAKSWHKQNPCRHGNIIPRPFFMILMLNE